jgi:hypothetical protein
LRCFFTAFAFAVHPGPEPDRRYLIIDGVLYGAISALLFYSKITFGLAAIAFAPIMFIRKRDNIIVIAVAAVVFLAIAAWVEIVYGIRFAWMTDVKMAGASVGRDQLSRILHVLRDNALELFGLFVVPALILLLLRKLTIAFVLFCAYVAAVSLLILSYSGQSYVLVLPIAFVFVALDALNSESAFAGPISEIMTRYALLSALASVLLVIESYPLAMNIAISTYRALHASPWDPTNEVLNKITTDRSDDNDGSKESFVPKIDKMAKLDMFALARATKPKDYWDDLLMSETGCARRSRLFPVAVRPETVP